MLVVALSVAKELVEELVEGGELKVGKEKEVVLPVGGIDEAKKDSHEAVLLEVGLGDVLSIVL